MRTTAIVCFLAMFTMGLHAQSKFLKDKEATEDLSKRVAELFKEKKIAASFKELTTYWPLPQSELNDLEDKTTKYLSIIDERFGKAIGILKVNDETISDIAIKEIYLVRYQNSAIRLIFTYYRNDNGWIVNAFKWDDNFSEEFK
jgi:hypothetical protein